LELFLYFVEIHKILSFDYARIRKSYTFEMKHVQSIFV